MLGKNTCYLQSNNTQWYDGDSVEGFLGHIDFFFNFRMETCIRYLQHVGISFWSYSVLCSHVCHQLVGSCHHLCH